MRTRNLSFHYDACEYIFFLLRRKTTSNVSYSGYNDAKYLGSTGFFPALQTYICRWNNTCHNNTNPDDEFNTLSNDTTFVFLFFRFHLFLILVF